MSPVHAVFEKGVFRPLGPVDLPEKAHVVLYPELVDEDAPPSAAMTRVYEILSRSYDTGRTDLAAQHDEHQP